MGLQAGEGHIVACGRGRHGALRVPAHETGQAPRPGDGLRLVPGFLGCEAQAALLAQARAVIAQAPFYVPVMPRTGRPFSVRMTNAGPLGWVSDRQGYRYQPAHPETGRPWPPIPPMLLDIWQRLAAWPAPPESCLVNDYAGGAKMGLHRDENEEDLSAPVVSVSLGDTALFRIGGATRRGKTRSLKLRSGDALVLAGPSRHFYHGVDRILEGSSTLIAEGGRINLTLRRVTKP